MQARGLDPRLSSDDGNSDEEMQSNTDDAMSEASSSHTEPTKPRDFASTLFGLDEAIETDKLAKRLGKGISGLKTNDSGSTLVPVVVTVDIYDGSFLRVIRFERIVFVDVGVLPPDRDIDNMPPPNGADTTILMDEQTKYLIGLARDYCAWPCLSCGSTTTRKLFPVEADGLLWSIPMSSAQLLEIFPLCAEEKCKRTLQEMRDHFRRRYPRKFPKPEGTEITLPCIACGAEPTIDDMDGMKRCGRCHTAIYCDTDCQRQDWEHHRLWCTALPKRPLGGVLEIMYRKENPGS